MTISFSRSVTSVTPAQFGAALLQQLGGNVLIRDGDARHFVAQVRRGSRGDTFVVERTGSRLAVTTSSSSKTLPVALETLRQIGLSRPRAASPSGHRRQALRRASRSVPTVHPTAGRRRSYRPVAAGTSRAHRASIQGFSTLGSFLFGFSINVPTPEFAPPNTPPNIIVSPVPQRRIGARPVLPAARALGEQHPDPQGARRMRYCRATRPPE